MHPCAHPFRSVRARPRMAAAALLAAVPVACGDPAPETSGPVAGSALAPRLVEVTRELGLPERGRDWPDGSYAIPEITGPGVGLLDYDGDGRLDLLQLRVPPPGRPDEPAPNRLWRGTEAGGFEEVAAAAGLDDPGFAQGLAAGDVDGDGHVDVYLANYGRDALYRNRGDGGFEDVTERAGIDDDLWSSSATFCDYDRDGDLDLYVAHYLRFDPEVRCLADSGFPDFCSPGNFDGEPDRLYRNEGAGRFRDVTGEAGLVPPGGGRTAKGLGVVCADLTGDGFPDFYIANDGEDNHLWVNRGDGSFAEQGMPRGAAVNRYGNPESSMGIAIGDANGDGRLDLFLTHLVGQNNTLYAGGESALYFDRTAEARMAVADWAMTGFGCGFADLDHDGDLDLAVANGRVYRAPGLPGGRLGEFWNVYAEPNQLFLNDGTGGFDETDAGDFSRDLEVSRGLAFGDLDEDGDLDLVLSNNDNTLRVFRNDAPASGTHWLMARVRAGRGDALGARVELTAGGRRQSRLVLTGYSYMSASDPRVHFGLGESQMYDSIDVVWPDGMLERFPGGEADRVIMLRRGGGARP